MRKEPNLERRIVGRPDAGKSLQDFLAAWLGVSRRAAKAVIDGRSVWVNRRCVWIAHHTLKSGDTVELAHAVMAAARRPVARREIAPEDRKHVRVLAEFGDFLVVDKPAGLLSAGPSFLRPFHRARRISAGPPSAALPSAGPPSA